MAITNDKMTNLEIINSMSEGYEKEVYKLDMESVDVRSRIITYNELVFIDSMKKASMFGCYCEGLSQIAMCKRIKDLFDSGKVKKVIIRDSTPAKVINFCRSNKYPMYYRENRELNDYSQVLPVESRFY